MLGQTKDITGLVRLVDFIIDLAHDFFERIVLLCQIIFFFQDGQGRFQQLCQLWFARLFGDEKRL